MHFLKNLSEKDLRTLKLGGAALAALLYLSLVLLPLKERRDYYRDQTVLKGKEAGEMAAMAARYGELKGELDRLRQANAGGKDGFTLFSFLDGAAADSGLKGKIKGMKPSVQEKEDYTESTVTVELEDVHIQPLMQYIHRVESSAQPVRIKKVDIKPRYSDPDKLGATLIITAVTMKR